MTLSPPCQSNLGSESRAGISPKRGSAAAAIEEKRGVFLPLTLILKETSRLYDFGRRGLYRPHSKEQCEHTEPEAQPKEEHFTCCIANRASKTLEPPQPYHSRSTLHAPVTSISHALYLSSAVLFPCPEPSSLHESSHIKALLSSTCTDETPSRSGRLTPHSRTLNTFHFITAPPGEREREEKKKKQESRHCCLKGTSYLLFRCTYVFNYASALRTPAVFPSEQCDREGK